MTLMRPMTHGDWIDAFRALAVTRGWDVRAQTGRALARFVDAIEQAIEAIEGGEEPECRG